MKKTIVLKIFLCLSLSGIVSSAFSQTFTSPRHTEGGDVAGTIEDGVEIYKGIPYAADTSGENRWHPPQPAEPWDGILQADTFGPVCIQENGFRQVIGSEDCLSLNIYVTEKRSQRLSRGKKKPVMVWIHGGSLKTGSGSGVDGSKMARKDVVVVTINYRVDFLGRFAHPALSASQTGEHLANYALMDQIAALRWIKRNIRAFGGDPKNVTIFGQSSGAASIHYLMGTPDSEGLFRKAIAQSGGITIGSSRFIDRPAPRNPVSLEDLGLIVAGFFNIPNDENAPAALRSLTAQQLINVFPDNESTMTPVVDYTLVTEPIAETFFYGRQHRVHYMGGGTSDDFAFFRFLGISVQALLEGFDINDIRALYPQFAGDDIGMSGIWGTDLISLGPHKFIAQQMYKVRRRGYFYYFDYMPTALQDHPAFMGPEHSADIAFVFDSLGCFPIFFGCLPYPVSAEDMEMADKVMTAWSNFAKRGDPNNYKEIRASRPNLVFQWVPTTKWFDYTTVIDNEGIHAERDFEEIKPRMDFLMEAFEERVQD
jgi:para-nitrobenzyl esterase